MDFNDPKTWFAGIAAVLSGLFAWSARRNVDAADKANADRDAAVKDHSLRIRILEANVATRTDIDGVNRRINEMGDAMTEQNGRILEAVLQKQRR